MNTITKRKKIKFFVFMFFLLTIVFVVFFTPLKDQLTSENINNFFNTFKQSVLAIPIFIVIMSIAVALMFPGCIFVVAAGLLFGPIKGMLVALIGINLGSFLAFMSGRTFLHDFVIHHVHRNDFLKKVNNHATKNGLFFVMLSRLVFIIPWNVFNYIVSLSTIKIKDYIIGSFIGMLPEVVILNIFGSSMSEAFDNPKVLILPVSLIIIMIIISLAMKKKFFKE